MGDTLANNTDLSKGERRYYLDNLKVFLIFLVILHHAGQPYGPTGGFWQYQSSLHENIPWLGSFFSVNAAFFMGLFFLISGYFLTGSYDRKGGNEFLKDKIIRYGIPMLFMFIVLQPLQMYFYYILYSGNTLIDFVSYYKNIYFGIGGKPNGFIESIGWPEMNFGHLWFVEHLLVYSLVYWLIRRIFLIDKTQHSFGNYGYRQIIILALFIALGSDLIRNWYPIDSWVGILGFIQAEIAHLPQYLTLFITGIIACRKSWFDSITKKTGYCVLKIGLLMALIIYLRLIIPDSVRMIIYENWAIYESFMAIFICWGLIIFFRERINTTSPCLQFLAENSYAAYIFHLPIVLAVQYSLDKVDILGPIGKFLIVSLLSIIITYGVSYGIRNLPHVRRVI